MKNNDFRTPIATLSAMARFGWTGLCAGAMLAQTRLLAPGHLHEGAALTGYLLCATWFAYNFVSPLRWQRWAGWASGGLAGCFFLLLHPAVQVAAMGAGALWALYYGLQRPGNAGLRAMPVLKPLVVSFAWAWMTVLLPVQVADWPQAAWMFAERMAFVFALALAYDLHDLEYDRQHGLDTMARRLRFRRTFWLINVALSLSAGCAAGSFFFEKYPLSVLYSLLLSLSFSALWLRWLFQQPHWAAWRKLGVDALMVAQAVGVFSSLIVIGAICH